MSKLLKLTDKFHKIAQSGPILGPDSSIIIQNALYSQFGNPPMTMINAISEKAYEGGGSASLLVETTSGTPVIKFDSKDNQLLAKELNSQFVSAIAKLLKQLQVQHPEVKPNEWSFFSPQFIILGAG